MLMSFFELFRLVNKIKPGTIKKINTQNIAIAETVSFFFINFFQNKNYNKIKLIREI